MPSDATFCSTTIARQWRHRRLLFLCGGCIFAPRHVPNLWSWVLKSASIFWSKSYAIWLVAKALLFLLATEDRSRSPHCLLRPVKTLKPPHLAKYEPVLASRSHSKRPKSTDKNSVKSDPGDKRSFLWNKKLTSRSKSVLEDTMRPLTYLRRTEHLKQRSRTLFWTWEYTKSRFQPKRQ